MTARTRLISALTIACLCLTAFAAAQQPTRNATGKPSAAVERERDFPAPAPAPAKPSADAPAAAPVVTAQATPDAVEQPATEAPAAAAADSPQLLTRTPDATVLLPAGTALRVTLAKGISTHATNPGDAFTGTIAEDVVVNGHTVVSKGATLTGRVTRVGEPRRFAGRPWVELHPETVISAEGKTLAINGNTVDTSNPHRFPVTDEGRIKGPAYGAGDKIELIAGTGSGAIAGTVIAGPMGSLIGAGAGAGAASGHFLIKHHSMTLPAGMQVIFEIGAPVSENATGAQ